jgi:hypothetical protein
MLIKSDANDESATILELDELWSFVFKKVNQAWIWIARGLKTRQVVAYADLEIEVVRHAKSCGTLFQHYSRTYLSTAVSEAFGGDSVSSSYRHVDRLTFFERNSTGEQNSCIFPLRETLR